MPIIPDVMAAHVCKHGQGKAQCRYLGENLYTPGKFFCLKTPAEKPIIDEEFTAWLKKKDAKRDTMPIGDNCGGYFETKCEKNAL